MRHTTFRYRLDPTVEQLASLWQHAGASRFAYNQCLHMVTRRSGQVEQTTARLACRGQASTS
jgi:hypothetical protein